MHVYVCARINGKTEYEQPKVDPEEPADFIIAGDGCAIELRFEADQYVGNRKDYDANIAEAVRMRDALTRHIEVLKERQQERLRRWGA